MNIDDVEKAGELKRKLAAERALLKVLESYRSGPLALVGVLIAGDAYRNDTRTFFVDDTLIRELLFLLAEREIRRRESECIGGLLELGVEVSA